MRTRIAIFVASASFLWMGCDFVQERNAAHKTSHVVAFDLSAYRNTFVDGKQFVCSTSMELAVLNVNGQEMVQEIEEDVILFEITDLEQGDVRFEASIISNTGETLFVGTHSEEILVDDFGEITIALTKLLPVLQVCPARLTLSIENDFQDAFIVANRDQRMTFSFADSLFWSASQREPCGVGPIARPCLRFDPDSGLVVVPRGEFAWVFGSFDSPPGTATVRFDSETGFSDVQVEVDFIEGPD